MATTTPSACLPQVDGLVAPPDVEIVVPVHDEERGLEPSVRRLHAYLTDGFPLSWVVTIADNASHDRTWPIACRLASTLDRVRAVHVDEKGRGRALRAAWTASDARVVAYMDVDLSTDLDALLPLVASVSTGHSDVAVGSRLMPGARVQRGPRRELLSRAYNLLLHVATRAPVADAQCGFKAVRTDVARALLPLVEDDAWFFDTELLLLAEHNRLRVHEVPVDWVDDADSRVAVVPTALGDLRGVVRVLLRLVRGEGSLPPDARLGALTPGGRGRQAPARHSRLRYVTRLVVRAGVLVCTAYGLVCMLRTVGRCRPRR
jgi:glycosyltransferase involved in cell wall biosynthesis